MRHTRAIGIGIILAAAWTASAKNAHAALTFTGIFQNSSNMLIGFSQDPQTLFALVLLCTFAALTAIFAGAMRFIPAFKEDGARGGTAGTLTRPGKALAAVMGLMSTGGVYYWSQSVGIETTLNAILGPLGVFGGALIALVMFAIIYFGFGAQNAGVGWKAALFMAGLAVIGYGAWQADKNVGMIGWLIVFIALLLMGIGMLARYGYQQGWHQPVTNWWDTPHQGGGGGGGGGAGRPGLWDRLKNWWNTPAPGPVQPQQPSPLPVPAPTPRGAGAQLLFTDERGNIITQIIAGQPFNVLVHAQQAQTARIERIQAAVLDAYGRPDPIAISTRQFTQSPQTPSDFMLAISDRACARLFGIGRYQQGQYPLRLYLRVSMLAGDDARTLEQNGLGVWAENSLILSMPTSGTLPGPDMPPQVPGHTPQIFITMSGDTDPNHASPIELTGHNKTVQLFIRAIDVPRNATFYWYTKIGPNARILPLGTGRELEIGSDVLKLNHQSRYTIFVRANRTKELPDLLEAQRELIVNPSTGFTVSIVSPKDTSELDNSPMIIGTPENMVELQAKANMEIEGLIYEWMAIGRNKKQSPLPTGKTTRITSTGLPDAENMIVVQVFTPQGKQMARAMRKLSIKTEPADSLSSETIQPDRTIDTTRRQAGRIIVRPRIGHQGHMNPLQEPFGNALNQMPKFANGRSYNTVQDINFEIIKSGMTTPLYLYTYIQKEDTGQIMDWQGSVLLDIGAAQKNIPLGRWVPIAPRKNTLPLLFAFKTPFHTEPGRYRAWAVLSRYPTHQKNTDALWDINYISFDVTQEEKQDSTMPQEIDVGKIKSLLDHLMTFKQWNADNTLDKEKIAFFDKLLSPRGNTLTEEALKLSEIRKALEQQELFYQRLLGNPTLSFEDPNELNYYRQLEKENQKALADLHRSDEHLDMMRQKIITALMPPNHIPFLVPRGRKNAGSIERTQWRSSTLAQSVRAACCAVLHERIDYYINHLTHIMKMQDERKKWGLP